MTSLPSISNELTIPERKDLPDLPLLPVGTDLEKMEYKLDYGWRELKAVAMPSSTSSIDVSSLGVTSTTNIPQKQRLTLPSFTDTTMQSSTSSTDVSSMGMTSSTQRRLPTFTEIKSITGLPPKVPKPTDQSRTMTIPSFSTSTRDPKMPKIDQSRGMVIPSFAVQEPRVVMKASRRLIIPSVRQTELPILSHFPARTGQNPEFKYPKSELSPKRPPKRVELKKEPRKLKITSSNSLEMNLSYVDDAAIQRTISDSIGSDPLYITFNKAYPDLLSQFLIGLSNMGCKSTATEPNVINGVWYGKKEECELASDNPFEIKEGKSSGTSFGGQIRYQDFVNHSISFIGSELDEIVKHHPVGVCVRYEHGDKECFTTLWITTDTIQRYDGRGDKNDVEQKAIDTTLIEFFAEQMPRYKYYPVELETHQLPHQTRLEVIKSELNDETTNQESKTTEEKKQDQVTWDPFNNLYPFIYIKLRGDGMTHENAVEEIATAAYDSKMMISLVGDFIRSIMVILKTQ